ncbi:bifunctional UDP-N-acetylglucosamine diphosphorylase/glucosamine-1-phosphate N-acetyltransferase GlmU [Halorhodospira halophila]|uniref:Bifunctional protein GlmU n=1 Tax=Halorhodospira halophila (strain DSM 244 / SL1) TaxID=349124 RepID=GLMU_HALHL|nr:bifunctional UDP-N-acetylglucosamine diphosphorylase/glucosamine-1-phosphate N-acetyltransferase GlmU [Halorhodospira halophila]A1WZS9.1 RecName: Full=Bifunctional protein GlmU; Includes: RecName: Full=UDP-N-acetylglucosamine pyrophosphorylase; AltName: Full=N-acetylglucosamine-1-phosphate uridyltransferase; Includes: RecName: Full=Glucosamine-1-phosphate N-acetyltransferase [Halorhodospira halophila SL1]ABM63191.1 glucosamine-1-phosphate N-acetyltransferase / UDP-N-acetylglucosamine pyrophosp
MRAPVAVVILAAGKGTRMRSAQPKVLQPLAGRPLLAHVLDTALALGPEQVHVVYGHGGDQVAAAHADYPVYWVEQPRQLGTGHAVACALPQIPDDHRVLVLYGDVPLVTPETLKPLLAGDGLELLAARVPDPTGYGRIIRDDDGAVVAIVEEKDADPEQRRVDEVNTGLLAASAGDLRRWMAALSADNAQGEYYLTDAVAAARADGTPVRARFTSEAGEASGINDLVQLAEVEEAFQRRWARRLLQGGLRLVAPHRFTLRGAVRHGTDCAVDADCTLEGEVQLGHGVQVGQGVILRDCVIEDGAQVGPYTVVEQAHIGAGCRVGPFAHLRPGTVLEEGARVGNFVETKAARLGPGAKANHLTYVGDAEVGARANLGAGTITCNYDGAEKHRTQIGEDAFIGSGSQLVAPVQVGARATIGAGTTLTSDAPADALTVGRSRARTIPGWQHPGLTGRRGPPDDNDATPASGGAKEE